MVVAFLKTQITHTTQIEMEVRVDEVEVKALDMAKIKTTRACQCNFRFQPHL
jgi:hypothetical protein